MASGVSGNLGWVCEPQVQAEAGISMGTLCSCCKELL